MSSNQPVPVVWDKRGIKSDTSIPRNLDSFVRAQIKEQIIRSPNITYTPVSWEDTQESLSAPGPSSTGLMGAPFIVAVTFVKIAHPLGARPSKKPEAGVVLKDAQPRQIIGLTPGYTQTPCTMLFSAAIFPPNSFEPGVFNMDDPTHHVGLITGKVQVEYMISYWKKTEI